MNKITRPFTESTALHDETGRLPKRGDRPLRLTDAEALLAAELAHVLDVQSRLVGVLGTMVLDIYDRDDPMGRDLLHMIYSETSNGMRQTKAAPLHFFRLESLARGRSLAQAVGKERAAVLMAKVRGQKL